MKAGETASPVTGLTFDEQMCMNALVKAYRIYSKLPKDHPMENIEFTTSLHRLQDLLAIRVVRRSFPNGWSFANKEERND